MTWKAFTFIAGSLLLAQTCQKEVNEYLRKPNAQFEFSLQKTACYGTCPTYVMELNGKGELHITGERFVGFKGERDTLLSKSELDTLKARIVAANFPALDSVYNNEGITDIPSNILQLSVGKAAYEKQVIARHEYPNKLRYLIYYCEQLRQRYFPNGEKEG